VKTVACPTIEEWSMLGVLPHTLLIGTEAAAAAIIAQHAPSLRAPIQHWRGAEGMKPLPSTGTLVIWEIKTLSRLQQHQLFTWMDRYAASVQVISVTESPLFPLVSAGAFLDKLYYRLNLVCLPLASASETRTLPQPDLFSDAVLEHPVAQSKRVARRRTERLATAPASHSIQESLLPDAQP
jgi:hypothetical protein